MNRIKNVRTQEAADENCTVLRQQEQADSNKNPPEPSGRGFIQIETLVDLIKAWQQRKILAEDVDFFEKQGGKICS